MTDYKNVLTPTEIREYGDEFCEIVDRIAEAKAAKLAGSINQVSNAAFKSTRSAVVSALATFIPNWKDINDDPRFTEFLQSRGQLETLRRAWAENDHDTVTTLFTLGAQQGFGQRPSENPANREAMRAASDFQYGRNDSRSGYGKVWTRSEIQEQYKRWAIHPPKTDHERAQKAKVEAEIHQAGLEGSIRG